MTIGHDSVEHGGMTQHPFLPQTESGMAGRGVGGPWGKRESTQRRDRGASRAGTPRGAGLGRRPGSRTPGRAGLGGRTARCRSAEGGGARAEGVPRGAQRSEGRAAGQRPAYLEVMGFPQPGPRAETPRHGTHIAPPRRSRRRTRAPPPAGLWGRCAISIHFEPPEVVLKAGFGGWDLKASPSTQRKRAVFTVELSLPWSGPFRGAPQQECCGDPGGMEPGGGAQIGLCP